MAHCRCRLTLTKGFNYKVISSIQITNKIKSANLLQARLEDSGKYLCWVNNTAGEETIQVTLTVTGKGYYNSEAKQTREKQSPGYLHIYGNNE